MEKYKLENQALLRKIKELEEKIKSNDDQFQAQKKDLMVVQTHLKKENFEYNSQIVDLQNKIGCYFVVFPVNFAKRKCSTPTS